MPCNVLFQDGGNGLARSAPLSEAVDKDNLVVLDGRVELVSAVKNHVSNGNC